VEVVHTTAPLPYAVPTALCGYVAVRLTDYASVLALEIYRLGYLRFSQ
jgi:hypothetical protein